jgi:BarA-like signal transduction histidine kinase
MAPKEHTSSDIMNINGQAKATKESCLEKPTSSTRFLQALTSKKNSP